MLDPLGFPVFVGIVGGIMILRYFINKCDKADNERRILLVDNNNIDNNNIDSNNNIEIPPKYEELPPKYEE